MKMITFDFSRPHGVVHAKADTLSPEEIDKLSKEWRSAPIGLLPSPTKEKSGFFIYIPPEEQEKYDKMDSEYQHGLWYGKNKL